MPHPTDVHVGLRLRTIRQSKGLTQAQLGERLGISFQQVQKYEKGTNRIGASRLHDAAEVLGVTVMDFFDGLYAKDKSQRFRAKTVRIAAEVQELPDEQQTAVLTIIKSLKETSSHGVA